MNHPVESPSWLSNGSAPAATGQDATAVAGQEAVAARTPQAPEPPGTDSPAYAATSTFGSEDGYGHADPYSQSSLGQEGSYLPSSSSSYGFGQDNPYSAGTEQQETESTIPPPPYPGLPYQRGNDTTAFRVPQARAGGAGAAAAGQPRQASLVVARLEPWSVMKFSFLMSLVAWVVLFVAVALLYFVLSGLGVFHAVQTTLSGVTSSQGSGGFSLSKYISASTVLGYTMLFGAVNIVLITALSTIGSMIYNLVTHLGGGIEVTLRETD